MFHTHNSDVQLIIATKTKAKERFYKAATSLVYIMQNHHLN
jgi:hypothetical protein